MKKYAHEWMKEKLMEIRNSGAVKKEEENRKPKGTSSGPRTSGTPAYNFNYHGLPIREEQSLPEDKIGETPPGWDRQNWIEVLTEKYQKLCKSTYDALYIKCKKKIGSEEKIGRGTGCCC